MDIDAKSLNNSLGLLAEGFEKVSTQKVIDLVSGFISISDLSGILKINFISDFVPVEKSVREKLLALVCISDKVYELYGKDISKTQNWLMTPNHLFFGFSPFHMVLGGKTDVVINKLNEWV